MPGYQPDFVFPFAINGVTPVISILMVFFGLKMPFRTRIYKPFILSCIVMLAIPLVARFGGSPTIKYHICLVLIVLYSFLQAVIESSICAFTAGLNSQSFSSMILGFGMSGLFYCILKIPFSLIKGPDALFIQAMTFYSLMALNQLFGGIFFDMMIKSQYYKYYHAKALAKLSEDNGSTNQSHSLHSNDS